MNIIFITNTLNQVGGIERFISILSDYFIESLNYNVTIIDLHSKEFNGFFSLNKNINLEILNISPLENLSIKSKMFKMKEVGEKVSNVLKNYEADIIITFHPSVSRYILFQKNKFKKSKIIVTEHNNHNVYSKKANIINLFTYKKADKLVVFTEYEKNFYNQFIKNVILLKNIEDSM